MATKRTGYKEPASYFSDDMMRAAKEWDRKQKEKEKAQKKSSGKAEKKK